MALELSQRKEHTTKLDSFLSCCNTTAKEESSSTKSFWSPGSRQTPASAAVYYGAISRGQYPGPHIPRQNAGAHGGHKVPQGYHLVTQEIERTETRRLLRPVTRGVKQAVRQDLSHLE